MACDAVRGVLTERASAIVGGFPERAQRILAAKGAIESNGLTDAGGDVVPAALQAAFAVLQREAAAGLVDAKNLGGFVRMNEPLCEDGNNFYVGMQDEIAKICEASAKTLEGLLDKWVEYLEKRSDMKDKVNPKVTKDESSETKNSSSNGKAKDGAEEKPKASEDQSTSTSTSTKTSSWEVCAERKEALVRLDSAWQAKVAAHLTTVLFDLGRCVDLVEKNMEKIVDPRGTEGGGGRQLMY
jgi:hypothetical protein